MSLVQITERAGVILRVPHGDRPPVVELELDDNQRVIEFEWHPMIGTQERVTVDWRWIAYVETRL